MSEYNYSSLSLIIFYISLHSIIYKYFIRPFSYLEVFPLPSSIKGVRMPCFENHPTNWNIQHVWYLLKGHWRKNCEQLNVLILSAIKTLILRKAVVEKIISDFYLIKNTIWGKMFILFYLNQKSSESIKLYMYVISRAVIHQFTDSQSESKEEVPLRPISENNYTIRLRQ